MLTAIILTYNESECLVNCLKSLKFCDSILVVDGGSSDDTLAIAKKYKAKIVAHPLANDFSAQRNFALSQVKSGWVLFVDADEIVSPALSEEILYSIKHFKTAKGFLIPRRDIMWGKPLFHGDSGNTRLLRLANLNSGTWTGKVHESWQVSGQVLSLSSPLIHTPHQTVSDFLSHLNYYSTLKADEFFSRGRSSNVFEIIFAPIARFLQLYIIKLGFLDGTAGFVHAMLMAMYAYLVASKLYLLKKGIPSKHA